jgi:DNA oxidative demethylase
MNFEKSPAVYIMAGRYRGTIYTGVTSNLGSRVLTHKDGGLPGFSTKYQTHSLVWYEHHETMEAAILRETRIKAWRRQWKIELIEALNRNWSDLSDNIMHRPHDPLSPARLRSPKKTNNSQPPSFETRPASAQPMSEGAIWNPAVDVQSGVPDGARHGAEAPSRCASGMTVLGEGINYYPSYFSADTQAELLALLRAAVAEAPLFTPEMPKTGKPFSVRMTNFGSLGWVSDRTRGYRYQATHPTTGKPWPAMPEMLTALWQDVASYPNPPEACLVNFYNTTAKMGLHQDRDEQDFDAPVVSISLGDTALFRFGGTTRGGKTQSVKLHSGDVLVFGGPARLCFHGIDKVYPATSTLLKDGGRINLTMRRVTKP